MENAAGGLVPEQGAPGDLDGQTLAVFPGAALALTVHAVARHILALVAEVHQRAHMVVHDADDVPAAPAVAPVGAARRHVFLPVEGHRTVAPAPGDDADGGFVDER